MFFGACTKYAAIKGPFDGDTINQDFMEYVVDKAEDKLELSEEQRVQFQAVVLNMLTTALEQRSKTDELRELTATEMRKAKLDMKKVNELLVCRMKLLRGVMKSGEDEFLKFHSSLTADQREALAQLILDHGKNGWHGGH